MRPCRASPRKELLQELRGETPAPLVTAKRLVQLPRAPAKDLAVGLGVLGQRQLWLEAIGLLRECWKSGGLRPDIFCLNAAAGACTRGIAWSWAVQLLQHHGRGLALDESSVNLVCSAYEKGSLWRSALQRLGSATSHAEVLAYNAVTSSSSNALMWQLSTGMLKVMSQRDIQPTIVSFTAALPTKEAEVPSWSLASLAFAQLHQWRLRADSAAANAAVAAAQGWRRAVEMGMSFQLHGLDLKLLGRNAMLHVLGINSQWQMALRCQLSDVVSFNSSIAAAEASSQWTLATEMLTRLSSTTQPTSISFNSVMNAVGASQEWRSALHLREVSTVECSDAIGFALVVCQHSLRWSAASCLLAEARKKRMSTSISGHNAALMACASQRWLEALEIFGQIQGVRKDEISFAAAAGACQEAGQWEQVLALRSLSWSGGAALQLLLQNAVHSAWRRARQWQGSVQLLQEMQEDEVLPDAVSFAATVQTCELGGAPGPAALALHCGASRAVSALRSC